MLCVLKPLFQKAAAYVTDAVFPPACPVCGKPLGFQDNVRRQVCEPCRDKLRYIESPRCMQCGKSIGNEEEEYCYDCVRIKHRFTRGLGVYSYTEGIKNSIYRFKYKNKREYAGFYGSEIYNQYKDIIRSWDADVLIPIPLHRSKLKLRGYNQAALIAEEIGKSFQIPVDSSLLIRDKKTVPQKELNDKERHKNLESAFNITNYGVKYKKVILVDDIYTTGMTIDTCADVLIESGVKSVYFVCLCIGKGF